MSRFGFACLFGRQKQIYLGLRTTFQELLVEAGQFIPIGRSSNGKSLQPPERLDLFPRMHTALALLGRGGNYPKQAGLIVN